MSARYALGFAGALAGLAALGSRQGSRTARASRGQRYQSATLTPGHTSEPEVVQAVRIAQRAQREGKHLGDGFFGSVYRVGDHIVKFPRYKVPHRKDKTPAEARGYLLHEAGVANELREAGHTIVPHIVFVDLPDGTPVLVREYGKEAKDLSVADLGQIEAALRAVETTGAGWDVADELLVLRRADGSLFVGDVGWWRYRGKPRSWMDDQELGTLMSNLARAQGHPDRVVWLFGTNLDGYVPTILDFIDELEQIQDPEDLIVALMAEDYGPDLANPIAEREEFGLPVPPSAREALSRIEAALARLGKQVELGFKPSPVRKLKRKAALRRRQRQSAGRDTVRA